MGKSQNWKLPANKKSQQIFISILEAAFELFSADFTGTTTNRIAERAGVNIASLYRYFKNKDAVLACLIDRFISETQMRVRTQLVPGTDVETLFRSLASSAVERYVENKKFLAVMYSEGGRLGMTDEIFKIRIEIAKDIARFVQSEYHRPEDLNVLQDMILSSLNSFMGIIQGGALQNRQIYDVQIFDLLIQKLVSEFR